VAPPEISATSPGRLPIEGSSVRPGRIAVLNTAAAIAQVLAVVASALTFAVGLYIRARRRRSGPKTLTQAFEQEMSEEQLIERAQKGFPQTEGLLDLSFVVSISIERSGAATVNYHHRMVNTTNQSCSRIVKEVWFQYSDPPLKIVPHSSPGCSLVIETIHQTPLSTYFACLMSPSLRPGQVADFNLDCTGGRFIENLYWRQRLARFTRSATIRLTLHDARIIEYRATHEAPDGREVLRTDAVLFRQDATSALLEFTLEYLKPNEVMTLVWKAETI
jgi:hypothetical protein